MTKVDVTWERHFNSHLFDRGDQGRLDSRKDLFISIRATTIGAMKGGAVSPTCHCISIRATTLGATSSLHRPCNCQYFNSRPFDRGD